MAGILIIYSTTDGHTHTICKRLKAVIETEGHEVTVRSITEQPAIDLQPFDLIVIGASIRYGKHSPALYRFIDENKALLKNKRSAFFSVNVVARKPDKQTPETNPYVARFVRQIDWRPQDVAVFAGRIDYPSIRFVDRQMIRLIMLMTKGPTDPKSVNEFTDWDAVDAFGRKLAAID